MNGRKTVIVDSVVQPVPLEFTYSELPLARTLETLVEDVQGIRLP